ncbi:uncharacterized protein Z520_02621 [Fonsecaea multimorphosa CBS 102226]|uniref:Uncharacterized protein n=1 Tax=Fonsecaea multimorphosa CBS 102226 TaxID=1442371 RepID=A0A0D2IZJ8_9EURO|nr:uncharacterized protein Z520_02621 [Fonsecaea multimorphosa CBS 102226]KIY02482.1 hypothetical protein Z520_02621 [Fonsecaea multimorphosa CBS 102226]OAL29120.1 hypothetical protein AYO22_02557 [Fonsecaea multimorphosa]
MATVDSNTRTVQLFTDRDSDFSEPKSPKSPSVSLSTSRNKSLRTWGLQRVDSRGRIDPSELQVKMVKVWHGLRRNKHAGSIVMIDFWFEQPQRSKRISAAAINVTFHAKSGTTSENLDVSTIKNGSSLSGDRKHSSPTPPAIIALAPEGYVGLSNKSTTKTLAGSINVGAAVGPLSATTEWVQESGKVSAGKATISGAARARNFHSDEGHKDTARWTLTEDEFNKTGIPCYVQTAILIERAEQDADIVATVDASVTLSEGELPDPSRSKSFRSKSFRSESSRQRLFGNLPASEAFVFRPGDKPKEGSGSVDAQTNVEDLDACWEEAVELTRTGGIHMLAPEPPRFTTAA